MSANVEMRPGDVYHSARVGSERKPRPGRPVEELMEDIVRQLIGYATCRVALPLVGAACRGYRHRWRHRVLHAAGSP